MNATCPWCKAPRAEGPRCDSCGAIYVKAEAIRTHGRAGLAAMTPAVQAPQPESHGLDLLLADASAGIPDEVRKVENPDLEWRLCIGVLPAALLVSFLLNQGQGGKFVQTLLFAMPLHELGHAVTAWFCGIAAMPSLWVTISAEGRGFVAPVLLFSAIAYLAYRAWRAGNTAGMALAGVLVLLQVTCTFGIKLKTAQALLTFGGDGGAIVFGTMLMATFFFGKDTQLYQGWLRWGFVAIGSGSFATVYSLWWKARTDRYVIPYGESERGGESDPVRLVEWYGWAERTMVDRYVMLGAVCLVVLAAVYARGILQAKRARDAHLTKEP